MTGLAFKIPFSSFYIQPMSFQLSQRFRLFFGVCIPQERLIYKETFKENVIKEHKTNP